MAKLIPSKTLSEHQLTPKLVESVCEEFCERLQLVADFLLLKTGNGANSQNSKRLSVLEPLSGGIEPYGKVRDAITANTKTLTVSVKEFEHQMNIQNLSSIKDLAEKIAKQAILLTEAAASAAYFSALTNIHCKPAKPGVVNRYSFERAKQELHMSYNKFRPDYEWPSSNQHVLELSKRFAEGIAVISHSCKQASENELASSVDRDQFATCFQSLQGVTASFLTALKGFASSRTEENRTRCLLFGKPLLVTVDSIVEFSSFSQFSGKPAVLTHEGHESQIEILGGAMAVISSCIQLLDTARSILHDKVHDKKNAASRWQKLANCVKAIGDSTKLLSASVREHTPMPSRRPSTDFT